MKQRTTSEYLTIYKNYKKMVVNLTSQIASYNSWSDETSRGETRSLYRKLIKEFDNCDFTQFTSEQLKELDWSFWDENIILMPIWAIDCLPNGQVVYSIDNSEIIFDKLKSLDKDVRYVSTAWGFNISQLRDSAINVILDSTL